MNRLATIDHLQQEKRGLMDLIVTLEDELTAKYVEEESEETEEDEDEEVLTKSDEAEEEEEVLTKSDEAEELEDLTKPDVVTELDELQDEHTD
jgi:restriction endonuclease S subunit